MQGVFLRHVSMDGRNERVLCVGDRNRLRLVVGAEAKSTSFCVRVEPKMTWFEYRSILAVFCMRVETDLFLL